jgi:hypothetical protein
MSGDFSNGQVVNGKQVNDEENKSQNATIERIQSFRDDLAEYRLLFAQNELTEEIGEAQQHRAYHQLAKGFLGLLKPYLTADDEVAESEAYWEEVGLGAFTVDPPAAITQPSRGEVDTALRRGDSRTLARAEPRNNVEAKRYAVKGLRDFDAAPAEWEVSWSVMFGPEVSPATLRGEIADPAVQVHPRSSRTEPITVTRTVRLPRRIIDEAVTQLEHFVRNLGMDVDLDDSGVPEFGFEEVYQDGED